MRKPTRCVAGCTSQPDWRLVLSRTNAPKLNFGGSTAAQATGITGGFGFGSSVATSAPSSQAAAPSGFVFGSAGSTTTTSAASGTTGGFTFSSSTTTQAGAASFGIGAAAPQASPAGLAFGTTPAAAATTTATLGAATQSAAPFSLGVQPAGGCGARRGRCGPRAVSREGSWGWRWRVCGLLLLVARDSASAWEQGFCDVLGVLLFSLWVWRERRK